MVILTIKNLLEYCLISICIILDMWKIYMVPEEKHRNDKRVGTKTKAEK